MRSKRALAPSPPLILLLVGVLRICSNHEKNFPSFFEHCRQTASAKKLLQEHEEDRRGEDALQEERWLHQCDRERERERERSRSTRENGICKLGVWKDSKQIFFHTFTALEYYRHHRPL